MPPRFLYVGACIVVDAEKECLEGIYLRNFREAAFRRSVVAGANGRAYLIDPIGGSILKVEPK